GAVPAASARLSSVVLPNPGSPTTTTTDRGPSAHWLRTPSPINASSPGRPTKTASAGALSLSLDITWRVVLTTEGANSREEPELRETPDAKQRPLAQGEALRAGHPLLHPRTESETAGMHRTSSRTGGQSGA